MAVSASTAFAVSVAFTMSFAFATAFTVTVSVTFAFTAAFTVTMMVAVTFTTAFTFSVTMFVATAATAFFVTTAVIAATAATFTAHHVDETLNFFVGSFAHGDNLTLEVQVLTCEGVVQVDNDRIVFYFEYNTLETVAIRIDEGQYRTGIDHFLIEVTIDAKYLLVKFEYVLFFVRTISLLNVENEVKVVPFLECGDLCLERVECHAHARDKLEGMFNGSFFYKLVNALFVVCKEFVCHSDIHVGSLFHCCIDYNV